MNVALGGLLVGFLQLRILKPKSKKSKWWVPACASGWTLAAAGATSLLDGIPGMVIVSMVFRGAILGAITGKVLVWMISPADNPSDNVQSIAFLLFLLPSEPSTLKQYG